MNKFLILISVFLTSCDNQQEIKEYQKKFIAENVNPKCELKFEYFEDSIIKQVSEVRNGKILGTQLHFSPNGIIRRRIFINEFGKTVGDETLYDEEGKMQDHYFGINIDTTLFHAKFSKNGKLISYEGHPRYLFGNSYAYPSDTLIFYIAAPLIPKHKTQVTIFEKNMKESWVRYINDIRQFDYKFVVPDDVTRLNFVLEIEIKDGEDKTIIKDINPNIEIMVNPIKPRKVKSKVN